MSIVAGVDFGTLSVRVSIFHSEKGRLGLGTANYPLIRKREDPDHATQSHSDHLRALVEAFQVALTSAGVNGADVKAVALDTTGSSVIPVDERLEPIDDYYLWCDHRAWREAAQITEAAHRSNLAAIDWCGGTYSSEWGWAKLLHWLRHNPEKRGRFRTALEHCDMIAATLCGIKRSEDLSRSVCAMGHKWMWNSDLGGYPKTEFLASVDPLLDGMDEKLQGRTLTSDRIAGTLSEEWASKLGLKAGIPIPVGAFDAHWDAIGAGVKLGDVVNVIGTSTCIMAISDKPGLIPGVCGVVQGSVHPGFLGIEAGLSATGDVFEAIARRAGRSVAELCGGLESYKAGSTGLLRVPWDNGDRTVLVNPELGGITIGWKLTHTAQDEMFAAIEGTAFHTRIILERLESHGVPIQRVINGGGIPQKNPVLNQVYANVLGKAIAVPQQDTTSLGSAIFAFLAAGAFRSIEDAQSALCPPFTEFHPIERDSRTSEALFEQFREIYFAFGRKGSPSSLGGVLPRLLSLASQEGKAADA